MTLDEILHKFAQCYTGPTTCPEPGCSAPTRWMPVVLFAVQGEHARVWPCAVLGYGTCNEHKRELRLVDVDTGTAGGIISKIAGILHETGQGSPDLDRTTVEWVELPLRN